MTIVSPLAQRRPARRRFESPGMYSDDDANSDASSACSERSYSSRNGGVAPHYLRQTEDVAEVLNHCASANWSERKEGLLGLQNLFKSQRMLRWILSNRENILNGFTRCNDLFLIYLKYIIWWIYSLHVFWDFLVFSHKTLKGSWFQKPLKYQKYIFPTFFLVCE